MRRLAPLAVLLPAIAAGQQAPSARALERYRQILMANPTEGVALDRLWQGYSDQGRSGELIADFGRESNYAGQMIHGLLLRKAGRNEDAAAAFRKAMALEPKNPNPMVALGRLALDGGDPGEAMTWLEAAADLLPDTDARKAEVLVELGSASLAASNLTKAAEAWERTAALAPADLNLRRQLIEAYVRNQLGMRAIPHLEVIVAKGTPQERAQAWQQIGAIHQAQGNQDAAIHALEQALAGVGWGNWMRSELNGQLIRLHQRYRRAPELEARWKKFVEENPRDIGAYLQLVEFYERTGEQAKQLTWLERLVVLAPKSGEYRLRLARLLAQLDLLERAAATYDELLGSEPLNIELVFERARIDVQREQPHAAGERIAALLARSGNDEGIRTKALEFYRAHRLFELAEKHLVEDAQSGSEESIVALGLFYFSRQRQAEARATLSQLVRPNDPPERRAAAHFRLAREFKAQNDVASATTALRSAIELSGEVREYHFMLGEIEAAAGRYAGAQAAFERAFALSTTALQEAEADQRLYDSLRNQKQPGEDDPGKSLPRPESAAAATSAAAQSYLLGLVRGAVDQPSEARLLRVARWQQWSRNTRLAIDYAQRALALNPQSIAAHDFLARLLALDPQTNGAQQHLRELADLDAANRPAYLRRLGQVQLQAGQIDEAMKAFRKLVEENPGDLDALNDLGIAQQRAEQWNDALATLKQIHALSPAPRKREAVNSLLRIYDRLGLRAQAAELLLQQIDAESDIRDRFTVFGDLLTLCTRHEMLDWLRAEFEQRHKIRADDYFTEVSLGRVLKAQGNKAAAFEVLADAAYSAPDPGEALPDLVREAEELHRLDSAVQLQEYFVRVVPQTGPEGLQRLAELQEKSLNPEAAGKTWARLAGKFPRDVHVLERAAAFERVWGSPAQALIWLRRVRAIEPSNHRVLIQLAELSLSDGDPAEAESCLEQILSQTQPETGSDPVRYPAVRPDDPSRLEISYRSTVRRRAGVPSPDALKALRTFWFDKAEAKGPPTDRQSRLEVIRQLAEIVAAKGDPASLEQWVERWCQPGTGTSERLWALYFAGASGRLLDEVEKLAAARRNDAGPVNAFIWLALQTGEFERLGKWNSDRQRTPFERDFLMIAFEQYLDEHRGPLPAGLTEKIFPDGQRANLWQAASELAQRGYAGPAANLGERVLERMTTQRAPFGVELAQWRIQAGELDAARATLRGARTGSGDLLSSALYSAIRSLYLLLPGNERPAFAEECLGSVKEEVQPIQAALTRALLAGLGGDDANARKQLDRLLELRPMMGVNEERSSAAARQWEFVLSTGAQLVAWQLEQLALHLWKKALADDAAIALQVQQAPPEGDAVRARVLEVRTRLAALQLMWGDSSETEEVVAEYLRHAGPDGLLPLAEALELFGANPIAVQIYRRLWSAEPANPHALRNAVNACRNAGDWDTLEETLTRVVTEGHFRQNQAAHRDLVHQLVEVLGHRGKLDKARTHLAEIIDNPPHDSRALLKLADLQQRSKEPVAAEATYRKLLGIEPANVAARLALAALLNAEKRTVDAIDILERASGSEIDARIATFNLAAGRIDEALAALDRVPENDQARVSLSLANDLAAREDGERAVRLLRAALGRDRASKMAFALQSRIIELLPAHADGSAIRRDVRRLRQMADSDGGSVGNYFSLLRREAPRLGLEQELEEEMVHAWDGGRGELAGGVALLAWKLSRDSREGADKLWSQLREHALLDAVSLQSIYECATGATDTPLRLDVLARLARIDPANSERLVTWARALLEAGQKPEAERVADELAARSVFSPDLLGTTAELYDAVGNAIKASEFYSRAVATDPSGQKPALHLSYFRLLMRENRLPAAHAELRVLSRNPAAEVVPAIFEYLKATGDLDQFEIATLGFRLSPARSEELRLMVFKALLEGRKVAEALLLAESAPSFLARAAGELRGAARETEQFAAVAAALETAVGQGQPGVSEALAWVLADWAEVELRSLQVDSAVDHLERAHELQLGVWSITERLAHLHIERNEPQLAARTLQTYLAVAKEPAEIEQARLLLKRIPGA